MKAMIIISSILIAVTSYGQVFSKPKVMVCPTKRPASLLKLPYDSTNVFAGTHGYVVSLWPDRMPCVLPYQAAKPMPNAIPGTKEKLSIPNFWDRVKPENTISKIKSWQH